MMIRPYRITDNEELIKIFKLNVPKYFSPNETNDFENYLKDYSDTYFTIEYQNQIVGGVGYYVKTKDKSGRITWIFFYPDYAGKGLGKKAVTHCLALIKLDPTVEKLVVTTSQFAYKFFEKFDYKLKRKEKDYWGVGLDLYEMEQPIKS